MPFDFIYKKRIAAALLLLISFFLFASCNNAEKNTSGTTAADDEILLKLNKEMIQKEQEQIQDYITRYGYDMKETPTGLHFMHIMEGKGPGVLINSEVALKYRISFLDGTYCYSSDSSGVMKIRVGQSTEPSGLQEGLLHLKEGGKALIIVPSYLAYGITGDGDKIGSNQSLVYNIEVLEVKQQ